LPAPLASGIVYVPLLPTYQSDVASDHSHPALLSGRLKVMSRFCS